ncbi:hypothetical protein B0H15DRAFT_922935 [Mycena belliarum]|uniref:polynucleotide adenylyltransferase n=1 Tax=Mycena belliarum TaxID=1033014 RepID=A0AAD6U214_9AGAR|nr:hypothetical protein B0H15DRAFT_922935 [Mycena belliae]
MAANIPSRRRKRNRENGQDTEGHTATAPFEAGTDFIRLEPDSDSEERERRKNRGRDGRGNGRGKDEDKERTRDANRADGNGRANGREREWDRGKRKYDMVFDPSDGYQNKKQRTDAKSRLAPWVDHVEWDGCNNAAELLHREVEGFVKWISPTPQEDEIRGLVVAIISRAVTASFPDATVFPFGSYATKLYLPLGDIDLVIRSQSMAYADKHAVLTALATTIKRSGITNKVTIIAKAKVPIVKFITNHEYGRFNVDLSINQENGIVAGGIINGFLKDFGGAGNCLALRALVLLTKLFLSQRGMNEVYTGGLGSYAIVCLVISFLQMHPKIRHAQIDPDKNLGVLVVEFFELYGNRFHYEEVGISLRDGGSYFGKRQRGWGWGEQWGGARRGGAGGLLSIEDPGDPTNDISAGSYNFQNVRRNLAGAHEILTATIYLRAGILEARRGGRAVRFRDHYAPDDMSILSSVLGVTQETLNNRALVKEVYDKETLHRLVGVPRKANGKPQSSARARAGVQDAWAEADMVLSDDGNDATRSPEQDGRYGIGLSPPKKRRKTGKYPVDEHIVTFTADSEDSEDSEEGALKPARSKERLGGVKAKDKSAQGDEALRIKGMGSRSSSGSSLDPAAKRDYWLSKANGLGSGSDE